MPIASQIFEVRGSGVSIECVDYWAWAYQWLLGVGKGQLRNYSWSRFKLATNDHDRQIFKSLIG